MNSYASLGIIKHAGQLNISGTDYDTELLRIAEKASRDVDKHTDRFFYIWEGTLYQDGSAYVAHLDFDCQSISSLTVDADGDGTYETTYNLASTAPYDAFLYPLNKTPKTFLKINPWGDIGHFGSGIQRALSITGIFGHGNDWPASYTHTATVTVGGALASTDSSVSISGNTTSELTAGMTLRIGSEQVYLNATPTGASNSTCAIARAVNGTTAAAATTGTVLSIYDYPGPIVQAVVIQTVRSWKRRESGYVNTIINTDIGSVQVYKGLDPDVKDAIDEYKRKRYP